MRNINIFPQAQCLIAFCAKTERKIESVSFRRGPPITDRVYRQYSGGRYVNGINKQFARSGFVTNSSACLFISQSQSNLSDVLLPPDIKPDL